MKMKVLPIKRLGKLVELAVEAMEKAPDAEVEVKIVAYFAIDNDGDLGFSLNAIVPVELPVNAEVSSSREWDNQGSGEVLIRICRPAAKARDSKRY